jgi:hypothetical protein
LADEVQVVDRCREALQESRRRSGDDERHLEAVEV